VAVWRASRGSPRAASRQNLRPEITINPEETGDFEAVASLTLPFLLNEFEVILRRVSERLVMTTALLKFVDHPRPVLCRCLSLGHIYDGVNGELVSKTSGDGDDMSGFIHIFEALRFLNLESGTGALTLPPHLKRATETAPGKFKRLYARYARDLCRPKWTQMLPIWAAKVPSV
jgi:hypothetical protein